MVDKAKREPDPFEEAYHQALDLPSKFVSSSTVDVGEGISFIVTKFEVIPDRFDDDGERKVGEINGDIIESRAHRFVDGQELVVSCRAVALEKLANQVPQVGDVVTLVRGKDEKKTVGWRYVIKRGEDPTP